MSLGKNIQYLRKQKKITQEQLAEIMSVSRQTISRWEADEIIPELNKLVALSMCMKKKELLAWMYISMWIVCQKQTVLRIFLRIAR